MSHKVLQQNLDVHQDSHDFVFGFRVQKLQLKDLPLSEVIECFRQIDA